VTTRPAGPTVVLDGGDHAHVSRGDGAMLRGSIDRIRETWPAAAIGVVSSSSTRLRLIDPAVHHLADGRPDEWRIDPAEPRRWNAPAWGLDLWLAATQRIELGYHQQRGMA
jgi:hypothetical protein